MIIRQIKGEDGKYYKKRYENIVKVYLPNKQLKVFVMLENPAAFMKLCIDNAAGIMAWDILKKRDPKKYYDIDRLEDVLPAYNDENPTGIFGDKAKVKRKLEVRSEISANYPNQPENW